MVTQEQWAIGFLHDKRATCREPVAIERNVKEHATTVWHGDFGMDIPDVDMRQYPSLTHAFAWDIGPQMRDICYRTATTCSRP